MKAAHQLWEWGLEPVTPYVSTLNTLAMRTPNEVVQRNKFLQKRCDLLLVEYNLSPRCYVGTDFELTLAREVYEQPIVMWCHEDYKNRKYVQYMATAILPTLEEALDYVRTFYGDM